jgi:hypothetical protein
LKKTALLMVLVIFFALIAGCAPGANDFAVEKETEPAGFLMGIWHGIISPVMFVISLFSDKYNIYEVRNNGGWYNFGFIIGAAIIFGGGGKGSSRRRSRRSD